MPAPLPNPPCSRAISARSNRCRFPPDGTTLASGGADETVRLWDVASGQEKTTLQGHIGSVESVSFSPDGTTLASGGADETVRLWDVASGQEKTTLQGHIGSVFSVSFSPDGTTLASGGADETVRLWDVASGQEKATLQGHTEGVESVSFSPDGTTLASGSEDQTVRLWDVASGQERANLQGHTGDVRSVSYSPDGTTLASGSEDQTVRLWDLASGQEKATLQGHTFWVTSVSFSPDGTTLASGSFDGTVRLWDVASGQEKATLQVASSAVYSVSFSPDGTTLATSGSWDTVRLWDVAGGQEKATLQGHTDYVESVTFSPDGSTLASGSRDGTILLWDMTPYTDAPVAPDTETDDDLPTQETALVEALVLGGEVEGLIVEFSRAIAGRPRDYAWGGTTDAHGRVEVTITSPGRGRLNGFYQARARTAGGEVAGQWHSIPLNRNRRQSLELTLGGAARVVASERLAVAKAAAGSLVTGFQFNAPNPFNSSTQIAYILAVAGPVRLEIYNTLGQPVRTLIDQVQPAGYYRVDWDARDRRGAGVAGGVYLMRLYYPEGCGSRSCSTSNRDRCSSQSALPS